MEQLWLREYSQALHECRILDGEDQALISIIEFPFPTKYENLDCLGLIAHGTIDPSRPGQRSGRRDPHSAKGDLFLMPADPGVHFRIPFFSQQSNNKVISSPS
jgi:hypothetical protein